jgi:S-adenosylmethionine:tRNA-ribosyltransferase-isomerase (queuine synthetase)
MSESPKIPKLELEKFTFSPPGPMGWNMAEYEQLLENPDQLVLNESTVNSQLDSLKGIQLVELSLSGELRAKHTTKTLPATDDVEEVPEIIIEEPELEEKVPEEEVAEEVVVEEVAEAIMEVPEPPQKKVTIIIKETSLKMPWISPLLSKTKKNR